MSENTALSRGKRRLADFFIQNKTEVDYKNVDVLRRFISPEGKILPSRRSGLVAINQRKLTKAVKRARAAGLLPFRNAEV
ncbi:MAG: 30S ribosomal protein S18 [Myxococcales bacterium]|nr:30S ribosomal protein S18 [Myxococcales bacterium]USN49973.1 MAG: 30S ribosomal protein S18 [Myxococcales bacterium]